MQGWLSKLAATLRTGQNTFRKNIVNGVRVQFHFQVFARRVDISFVGGLGDGSSWATGSATKTGIDFKESLLSPLEGSFDYEVATRNGLLLPSLLTLKISTQTKIYQTLHFKVPGQVSGVEGRKVQ